MFGSAALDTAIGLITIFLMLSLVCSALNEMLASVTNRRGKFLRLGIARMLGDDEPTDRTSVTADFFRDRRIASLSRGRRLPSYIPPSTFGAVAADLASGSTALSGGARVRNVLTIARATGPQDGNPVVRQLLRDAVESASALPPRLLDEPPAAAMARIEAALGRAFDDTMNRASGWYRRNTQGWLFVIALIVVWAINADTLTIVRHLAVDEKTRTALADIGANQAREPVDPGTGDAGSEATNLNAAEREAKLAEAYAKRAKHILESTRGLALPLGWTWSEACAVYASSAWYSKTFGLLITAIAVALGAPFWFDVLQKLASLRSTGGKPPPTPSTAPADEGGGSAGGAGTGGSAGGAGGGGPAGVGAGAAASSADRVGALAISASNAATVPALAPGYWSALARAGAWRTLDPEAIGTRLRLAQLSAIAYRPAPIAEQLLRDLGAAGVEFFDAGGTQAFACRIHDDVVVSFRGTQPREVQDLVADANIALRPFVIGKAGSEITVGRAHAGFAAALRCVLAPLEKRVLDLHEGDARIWLTGHSLGGALASLLCAHLAVSRKELAPRLRLVTFAAPRVGDQALRDEIGRRLAADSALHVALERDPVPLVPPWSMDFRHLGTVRTFSIGGVESTGEGWRALLDTLMDASTDLRRAGAESLRRHGIEVYIAALEQTAEVASA